MSSINKNLILFLVLMTILSSLILFAPQAYSATVYGNYRNVSIQTRVNITNSKPEVLGVRVYQETNYSARNITLGAGALRDVTCNATVRDWNGYGDIAVVNATFYNINSSSSAGNNENFHYSNASCTNITGTNYTAEYICTLPVYYFAMNGTWTCNVTVYDSYNKSGWGANTTVVYPLYALNVTDGIDYGNVAVEDYSISTTANITNFGNRNINVSVEGWGAVRRDGLAMNCSINSNITIANERFTLNNTGDTGADWALKIPATSTSSPLIPNLTIEKQTQVATFMTNETYWQLYIPPNPAGNCTGYLLFSAELP